MHCRKDARILTLSSLNLSRRRTGRGTESAGIAYHACVCEQGLEGSRTSGGSKTEGRPMMRARRRHVTGNSPAVMMGLSAQDSQ